MLSQLKHAMTKASAGRSFVPTLGAARFFAEEAANELSEAEVAAKAVEQIKKLRQRFRPSATPQSLRKPLPGMEPLEVSGDEWALSGLKREDNAREVFIEPVPPNPNFTEKGRSHIWRVRWLSTSEGWNNPLMGWWSSTDPYDNVYLYFDSKEDAVNFCNSNGWQFHVSERRGLLSPDEVPTPEQEEFESFINQSYSDNFLSKELKQIMKEQGQDNTIWVHNGFGKSNWHLPLRFHGDGEVDQHGPNPNDRKA
jgi:hypothetical protein